MPQSLTSVRLATFNVENLLTRYDFKGNKARGRGLFGLMRRMGRKGASYRPSRFELEEAERLATAYAFADLKADAVFLQEIESSAVLEDFERHYLRPLGQMFSHQSVLEGNDLRGIDVGVVAKQSLSFTSQSHKELTYRDLDLFSDDLSRAGMNKNDRIFKRDCLEVTLNVAGKPLTVFVCHFKSMRPSKTMVRAFGDGANWRDITGIIRSAEARAVRSLVEARFGTDVTKKDWIICGDFNDYNFSNGAPVDGASFSCLLEDGFAINPAEAVVPKHRWSHYYLPRESYSQLDYMLLSPALFAKNKDERPYFLRKGMPLRVPALEGYSRYAGIGWSRPKASDHCPLVMELKV